MADVIRAIGLMSGTSMDGVDVAVLETDGGEVIRRCPEFSSSVSYSEPARALVRRAMDAVRGAGSRAACDNIAEVRDAGRAVTQAHWIAEAVIAATRVEGAAVAGDGDLVAGVLGLGARGFAVCGFHGQTILHRPDLGFTVQIGDAELLAQLLGTTVVHDFRANDMTHGGQGAPLIPAYHRALAHSAGLTGPLAILNIGGVANVTWIGADGALLAFDVGPGNALIDDHVQRATGRAYDAGGALAARGQAAHGVVQSWLQHPYFAEQPPKSLDREAFHDLVDTALGADWSAATGHGVEDGAALLTAFTVEAVAAARAHFPVAPERWIVCGGGAANATLMRWLADRLGVPVEPAEAHGWSSDFMEAEGFAYLAVRALAGLPLSWPTTTGVRVPVTGGRIIRPTAR